MIISVEDAKTHLNITDDTDNALVGRLIDAAEAFVNRWLPVPLAEMTTVDADLVQAVHMLTGHFYENREASLVGITAETGPLGFWDIINQHRDWSF